MYPLTMQHFTKNPLEMVYIPHVMVNLTKVSDMDTNLLGSFHPAKYISEGDITVFC